MNIDIRLPNINGSTDSEQLAQIRSYLYQFIPQLQWALGNLQASNVTNATEQVTSATSKKEEATPNFNQLKSLIIKSADIVEAFYDEITKLADQKGKYVASSDFGKFVEETNNLLYVDDKSLKQELKDVQQIFDEDGNIRAEKLVNGHIYSGIIEYAKSGEAIVGIEIGQTTNVDGKETFNKFARFTADRLSFYDTNATEVAYISDYKLYITNAWITGTLRLGCKEVVENGKTYLQGFEINTSNGIALIPFKEEVV